VGRLDMNMTHKKVKQQKYNIDVESFLWLPGNVNVFWKNLDGVYQGCNDVVASILNLPSRQAVVGTIDSDYPYKEKKLYREEDIEVTSTGIAKNFLSHMTIGGQRINLLALKMPLTNKNGNIVGLFGISYHLAEHESKQTLSKLAEIGLPTKNFYLDNHNSQNNIKLTQRQLECLYYLVKGLTAKDTGEVMGLSYRTIEFYLKNTKAKLNCKSRVELIEKALNINEIKKRLLS